MSIFSFSGSRMCCCYIEPLEFTASGIYSNVLCSVPTIPSYFVPSACFSLVALGQNSVYVIGYKLNYFGHSKFLGHVPSHIGLQIIIMYPTLQFVDTP